MYMYIKDMWVSGSLPNEGNKILFDTIKIECYHFNANSFQLQNKNKKNIYIGEKEGKMFDKIQYKSKKIIVEKIAKKKLTM